MKNNIILIGMMGAGKTTVAKHLADSLIGYNLIDIDSEIEKLAKMKISEIFDKYSEQHFRKLETDCIKTFLTKDNLIISVGGGAFEKEENRNILKENGTVIYLKTSANVLFERIKKETHRPLLKTGFDEKNINEILIKREFNYKKAHLIIDTTDKSFYNIIKEITERIAARA